MEILERLSFGGRITLLKSVLSSLAIFTLSFYKALKKIILEINKKQRNFLWGVQKGSIKFIGLVRNMFVIRLRRVVSVLEDWKISTLRFC